MNKKVLTLCASFLLAGGLTSQAFATVFTDVTDSQIKEGQYFYVYTNPLTAPTVPAAGSATAPTASTSGVLDVNGISASEAGEGGNYWSKVTNRETWWRVEEATTVVNGKTVVLGYKLINALTGKALTVKDAAGNSYDIFKKNGSTGAAMEALVPYVAEGETNLIVTENAKKNLEVITDDGSSRFFINLQPVDTETLTGEEANKVVNGAFGLQFGYINDKGAYVNYESVEGADALTGTLVAKYGDDLSAFDKISGFTKPAKGAETFCIYNKSADAYVVLLKEKWSASNTNHDSSIEGNGHKFALMTAKQIIEDQNQTDPDDKKIASFIFSINMPVNKDYSPLEVVAKDAVNGKDVELYIANMDNKDYLTTTLAGKRDANNKVTTDDADKVAYDPAKTVVRFGTSDYINFSEFYGYAITIKGLAGTGVEGMTLESNQKVSTEATWTKADYLAFSRPEAQWIVTNENARIVLTNRETKTQTTWGHIFDMLGDGLSLRHESGDTYVSGGYKFEIKKVAELGGETFNHYGVYEKDASEIGTTRTYKVTFADAFGATTYVGMDGKGNVELTQDETAAINFDLVKTQTADTLNNDGSIAENAAVDVFHIINNIMAKNKDGEWEYKAAGDTLSYFRYKLACGDKFLTYNSNKKQFELISEKLVYMDANAADKDVDYANSILADNYIVKLKENDKVNVVSVINYEMENIESGKYSTNKDNEKKVNNVIYKLGSATGAMFPDDEKTTNSSEGEKLLANGEMMFFDFNNAEVQEQQNIYAWNANAQLTIVRDTLDSYRYFATPDTMEFYRVEYADEFLYEKVQNGINFLGMTYDRKTYNPAIYVDTAYIQNTKKPTYLLALAPEIEPSHKYCPTHGIDPDASVCVPEHQTTIPGYVTARYLVSFTDSVAKHAAELKNPYLEDGKYTKLGFVDAVHGVNDLNIIQNGDTVKTYELTDAAAKAALNPVEFAFRIANQETKSFYIESVDNGKVSYIRWQNGVPVLTTDITDAEEFNVRETSENPTANEEISAEEATVSVVATDGAVIVKGAEGKNVIVSTILGKVVANETVNSDNETIAAPAGIVVVAVDGESFKVVVK